MQLVIAEKPSVAKSIADVLGALDRQDGYFEGGGYLVSWCVGHLIELAEPESYGDQSLQNRKAMEISGRNGLTRAFRSIRSIGSMRSRRIPKNSTMCFMVFCMTAEWTR